MAVTAGQLDTLLHAFGVVEGGQNDRGTELALIDQVMRLLVVGVHAQRQPGDHNLADTDIEVVGPLGPHRIVWVPAGAPVVSAVDPPSGQPEGVLYYNITNDETLTMQFGGNLRDPSALITRAIQFLLRRLTRPVAAGYRRGAVR